MVKSMTEKLTDETKYSGIDQVKLVEDLKQIISLHFFDGCLLHILLGPFLNTLPQMRNNRPG